MGDSCGNLAPSSSVYGVFSAFFHSLLPQIIALAKLSLAVVSTRVSQHVAPIIMFTTQITVETAATKRLIASGQTSQITAQMAVS